MNQKKRKVFRTSILLAMAIGITLVLAAPGALAKEKGAKSTKSEKKEVVDLNNASQKELETLPGVGAAAAKKIIAGRPYRSVDELTRSGLSTKKIEAIKSQVMIGSAPAVAPALSEGKTKETKAAKGAKSPKAETKVVVDLNNASQKELEALPGVGAATAKKIVAGRPYRSVDELSRAGLSAKKVGALKSQVMIGSAPLATPAPTPSSSGGKMGVSAPSSPKATATQEKPAAASKKKLVPGQMVNINTASKEELEALPGIGPAKAQAIIDGRPYSTSEDVMKVKGIKQGIFNKIKDNITVH